MKKVIALLVLFALATPTLARVNVYCTTDCNSVTVNYVFDGNNVRAFALDIQVDSDANIIDVNEGSLNADYWVYPGSIVIVSGSIDSNGTPVADPCDAPGGTQAGVNTPGMTVEMGSLYTGVGAGNEPSVSGTLLHFMVDRDCNVTISENTVRGGIVMEDPDEDADPNITGGSTYGTCGPGPCYTGPDVVEWRAVGSPTQWCNPRQCHGDADHATEKIGTRNKRWVGYRDIDILLDGFNVAYGAAPGVYNGDPSVETWITADFDHATEKIGTRNKRHVGYRDIDVLLKYFNMADNEATGRAPDPNCLD